MTEEGIPAKLEIVRQNLERLSQLPQASFAEFNADFRNLDSALHRLQTTIHALIDIASFLVSVRGLGIPQTSLDALEKLETAGLTLSDAASALKSVLGRGGPIRSACDRSISRVAGAPKRGQT